MALSNNPQDLDLKDYNFVSRVTLLQKDTKFAVGFDGGKIAIYNNNQDKPEAILNCDSDVTNIIELTNGRLVSSEKGIGEKGEVKIWNLEKYSCEVTLSGHQGWALSLLELPNNKLATGSRDGKVKIWSLISYKCVQEIDNEKSKIPNQTRFNCQGLLLMKDDVLLCGNYDKIDAYKPYRPLKTEKKVDLVSFFNVDKRVYEDSKFASFEGHKGIIRVLKAFEDGLRFLSGSGDTSIKVWDLKTQSCLYTFTEHKSDVDDLIIYGGKLVISGDRQATIIIWDIETYKVVQNISTKTSQITSIASKSDKTVITAHGIDSILKFWSNE